MREYIVSLNGWTTTVQLSDEDASARGLSVADEDAKPVTADGPKE
jgi:hypothetical protein